ncbi:nickel ABC transporter permease subunit NikC [Helicobacter cinaedi]|uniref:nickel ABC transporter permease subunit NikC n=1 Tax=Helicobacter cinaedi TaxID=213 RepID=UPI000DA156BF|nr:nickel ABC transporter permease subunit NikC [Helicobacter cinaedi]
MRVDSLRGLSLVGKMDLYGKIALCGVMILCTVAVFAPFIAPYPPDMQNLDARLLASSVEHILGTDYLGRDICSRLLYGARISLGSTFVILAWIMALGICIGGLCGFLGGWIDSVCMRICDIFMSVPTIALSLFMVGILGAGLENVILAIVLTHWAWYARIVRGIVFSLKNKEYILLSYTFGVSGFQRFKRHLFTPIMSQCLVLASMDVGHIMLHIAGLSFLGLGVQPPNAEWGVMISEAKEYMWDYPHLIMYPGLALFISVALCNLLGESLRDGLGVKVGLDDIKGVGKDLENLAISDIQSLSVVNLSIAKNNYKGDLNLKRDSKTQDSIMLDSSTPLLSSIDLELKRGECVALLGRSGSGKSLIAYALQGFMANNLTQISGEVRLNNAAINPVAYRGRAFISIMQNPRTCFNPLLTLHAHCKESLKALKKPYNKAFILECFTQAGLDVAYLESYPFELSGGMLQRAMIALALLTQAPFIIADEPSSDLDKGKANEILSTLKSLQKQKSLGILLITHDLEVVAEYAERVSVISQGRIIERGKIQRDETKGHSKVSVANAKGDFINPPQSPTLQRLNRILAQGISHKNRKDLPQGELC